MLLPPRTCEENVSVDGERVTPKIPVPVNGIDCPGSPPPKVTVTEPDRRPVALGVNVTDMVQVALTSRVAGHVWVML